MSSQQGATTCNEQDAPEFSGPLETDISISTHFGDPIAQKGMLPHGKHSIGSAQIWREGSQNRGNAFWCPIKTAPSTAPGSGGLSSSLHSVSPTSAHGTEVEDVRVGQKPGGGGGSVLPGLQLSAAWLWPFPSVRGIT